MNEFLQCSNVISIEFQEKIMFSFAYDHFSRDNSARFSSHKHVPASRGFSLMENFHGGVLFPPRSTSRYRSYALLIGQISKSQEIPQNSWKLLQNLSKSALNPLETSTKKKYSNETTEEEKNGTPSKFSQKPERKRKYFVYHPSHYMSKIQ